MSQFPPHSSLNQYGEAEIAPKTSGVATAAFVCSLIFCCPLTSFIGIVMGMIAFIWVGMDPVMRRGKGLAIIAVLIGVVGLALQAGVVIKAIPFISKAFEVGRFVLVGPQEFAAAVEQGDFVAARDLMDADIAATLTDEDFARLQEMIQDRHGACRGWEMNQQGSPSGGAVVTGEVMTLTGTLTFANGNCDATFEVTITEMSPPDYVRFGISEMTIHDPVNGDITFPFPAGVLPGGEGEGG